MGKKIFKSFKMYDLESQENWLNEMADKGLVPTSLGGFFYEFDECEPGEYTIRFICLKNSPDADAESKELIEMITETGAELISQPNGQICWFRRKRELGDFQLFSDLESRIAHLSRIEKIPLRLIPLLMLFMLTDIKGITAHAPLQTALFIAKLVLLIMQVKGYLNVYKAKSRLIKQYRITEN